jgi:hypothetical protein
MSQLPDYSALEQAAIAEVAAVFPASWTAVAIPSEDGGADAACIGVEAKAGVFQVSLWLPSPDAQPEQRGVISYQVTIPVGRAGGVMLSYGVAGDVAGACARARAVLTEQLRALSALLPEVQL